MGWTYRERLRRYRSRERGSSRQQAPFRVALCYPNRYAVAASSLGYQLIYRLMNAHPGVSASRACAPDPDVRGDLPEEGVLTLEDEAPLRGYDAVAFSISYEMDLVQLIELLESAGIPPLREERGPGDPLVLVGGPMTQSNPMPLAPFSDAIVVGEAEGVLPRVLDALQGPGDGAARRRALAEIEGVYVPPIHDGGDGSPVPDPAVVDASHLPAYGAWWSPDSELSDMFLVEASRGCPRYCKFCVVRASNSPMRWRPPEHVLQPIPREAPRVGFVGAAVSEYPHIRACLRACVDRGQGVGLSSLRADRLDDELLALLVRGGARTLTIASDAPSEVMRSRMAKGLKERHLLRAAELARAHGLHRLKIYAIIGLPGEREADLDDLVRFSLDLSRVHKVTLAVNPLVPKLRTPLATAPFAGIPELDAKIRRLRRGLKGRVELRALSPRWAWVETMLGQGGAETGLAALEVATTPGRFSDWKRALSKVAQPFAARDLAVEQGRISWIPRR